MTQLSVNVNKIATLRNTRENGIPDVARLSAIALDAGAHGITVHPRPDQRHIRSDDVALIAAVVARVPGAEYNIEGNPFHGLIEHCERTRPTQATLVPDAREAFTSNHGWNLTEIGGDELAALEGAIRRLRALGCRVSLFVDPLPELMPLAKKLGTDRVELYTEPYGIAFARRTCRPHRRALRGGCGGGARCRPRRQRRSRSQPRQPRAVPGRGASRRRGVDRPRADRRRAGARPRRDRAALSRHLRAFYGTGWPKQLTRIVRAVIFPAIASTQ